MQVVYIYFENGIIFFINFIYSVIWYIVFNGDVVFFVGYNVIFCWFVIQQVLYEDEDGYEKFWFESYVLEDFDMFLCFQCNGYIICFVVWVGEGFKEGVLFIVYDELVCWEKYVYGCNELFFYFICMWIWKGLFMFFFCCFLFFNICFIFKIIVVFYIGIYYVIGVVWIMISVNYFFMGWFNGYFDKYYVDLWQVWFFIIIVFNGLGNIVLVVMRYCVGECNILYVIFENFKWIFLLVIFLGGFLLYVLQVLLVYMFEIDMIWGVISKEVEFFNFFIEVFKVFKKVCYLFCYFYMSIMLIWLLV